MLKPPGGIWGWWQRPDEDGKHGEGLVAYWDYTGNAWRFLKFSGHIGD